MPARPRRDHRSADRPADRRQDPERPGDRSTESELTACGGFTVITASVRNVNLPNGTVVWVTLGGEPIGQITLNGGAGSMAPWTLAISTLRKQGMAIFTAPPTNLVTDVAIMSGPFV